MKLVLLNENLEGKIIANTIYNENGTIYHNFNKKTPTSIGGR